jgi:hypothetical protein
LDKAEEKTREEAIKEISNFVVHVLKTIKPSILISCRSLAARVGIKMIVEAP